MNLPPGFQFNQSVLQDFEDCPRRFYLKYVRRLAWPAVEAEPILAIEGQIRNGSFFHRLAHQYLLGVPLENLQRSILAEPMISWWDNLMNSLPELILPGRLILPEFNLSAPWDENRILSKYDLLLITEDRRVLIYEWKTYHSRPKRNWLEQRLQTIVYLFMTLFAKMALPNLENLEPEQVSMTYWFANFPNSPETFHYSAKQFARAKEKIQNMIEDVHLLISSGKEDAFALTRDIKYCAFCNYRSLCNRGVGAGTVLEDENTLELDPDLSDINLDDIPEIEF